MYHKDEGSLFHLILSLNYSTKHLRTAYYKSGTGLFYLIQKPYEIDHYYYACIINMATKSMEINRLIYVGVRYFAFDTGNLSDSYTQSKSFAEGDILSFFRCRCIRAFKTSPYKRVLTVLHKVMYQFFICIVSVMVCFIW